MEEQLAGPIKEVLEDFKRKFREFQESEPLWSVLMGFVHAVDWKEPWIRGLVAAQALVLLLAVATRKHTTVQTCIFAYAIGIVYLGERLNKLASQQWERFSSQNYFDPHGVFFSTVVSGPLLLVMFIVLINYLMSCVTLLIKAKRMELKHKAKERKKQEGGGAAAGGPPEGKKKQ